LTVGIFIFSIGGSGFSFSTDQRGTPPSVPSTPPSLFTNKRPFDNAFYPSPPATLDGPPPSSSYQSGWTNNRGGYSNNYRGGGGYNRFAKRSRPYNH